MNIIITNDISIYIAKYRYIIIFNCEKSIDPLMAIRIYTRYTSF